MGLLSKGKIKFDSLFQRRKRAKNENRKPSIVESDVEDEVPILSRIADPVSTDLSRFKLNTKQDVEGATDEEDERHKQQGDEMTKRAQKRKGIVGIDSLKDGGHFNTQTVMSGNRAVARQPPAAAPAAAGRNQQFNFSSRAAESAAQPSFGPWTRSTQPSQSQLRQAAKIAFLKSEPEAPEMPEELFISQKREMTIQQFLNMDVHNEHQLLNTKPHPLNHLKLSSKRASASQVDVASPVRNIADFVRPQVESPEATSDLSRSNYHQPNTPGNIFVRTIPDQHEANIFALDTEAAVRPPEKTDSPGNPRHVHNTLGERVPLGARLVQDPSSRPQITYQGASRLPHHAARKPRLAETQHGEASVPNTFYTAPNRLSSAYFSARRNLKRKRLSNTTSLPPPSFIHQHTGNSDFNIFRNGILLYPELCLLLAAQLTVQTLINLYSISKDFHVILNQRFTTVILNQASLKAPHATRSYPWRCFDHLSQPDPSLRSGTSSLASHLDRSGPGGATIKPSTAPPPPQNPNATTPSHIRRVPTFRWLHLAIHREKTVWALYHLFAARGVPLPGHPAHIHPGSFTSTLHKLWFLFSIPDNPRRSAYTHSPTLFTAHDLSNALVFFVKLDMICNDPLGAEKRDAIRKMLLSSAYGFDTILRVLRREEWRNELEVLRAWTRYGFQLDREGGGERAIGGGWIPLGLTRTEHEASKSVFGIPREEVGLLKKEFWGALDWDSKNKTRVENGSHRGFGRAPRYLMRPDQLVLREAVKRGLVFRKQFLRALLDGYVDEESEELGALPLTDVNGGRSEVLEKEGEYEVDDVVAGVQALSVEEGGDELLDLGDIDKGSPWTVVQHGVSDRELELRQRDENKRNAYMDAWKDEVRREEEERAKMAYRGWD